MSAGDLSLVAIHRETDDEHPDVLEETTPDDPAVRGAISHWELLESAAGDLLFPLAIGPGEAEAQPSEPSADNPRRTTSETDCSRSRACVVCGARPYKRCSLLAPPPEAKRGPADGPGVSGSLARPCCHPSATQHGGKARDAVGRGAGHFGLLSYLGRGSEGRHVTPLERRSRSSKPLGSVAPSPSRR